MKTRISRDLVLFIILIPLFLWGAFYISSRTENRLPAYSVENKALSGYSVIYEAMRELRYPVSVTLQPIKLRGTRSIQVAVQNGGFDVNSDEMKAWVKAGGVLVYLTPGNLPDLIYGVPSRKGSLSLHEYGRGEVIEADVSSLANSTLTKKTDGAYELLEQLDRHSYDSIVFNEAHLYSPVYEKTLWDYMPAGVKFLIYQLLLVLAAFFYCKGKRFGKPVPLHEETERVENEYLYSAASLYRQAGCWDLMLESYYRDFLKRLGSSHDSWLEYWEREKLPEYGRARKVHAFVQQRKQKTAVKEYIQTIAAIEQLKGILKKRRGAYWKTLKKTT